MPKVSVLMPVYNTNHAYLRQAIESILSQTFEDFEFLILNDHSTDFQIEKIIKSFQDVRIKYYNNKKNLGISGARNKLLDLAQGEYLAIMDHDDISLPERLQKQVDYLDKHPYVGAVGSAHGHIGRNDIFHRPISNKKIRETIFFVCPLHHPTTMLRKEVLTQNNIRYEEDFTPAEDYLPWRRLRDGTKLHNLPDVLFIYRDNYENTTHKDLNFMFSQAAKVQKTVINKHRELYAFCKAKKKLKKHLKHLLLPLAKTLCWLTEPFAILYHLLKTVYLAILCRFKN